VVDVAALAETLQLSYATLGRHAPWPAFSVAREHAKLACSSSRSSTVGYEQSLAGIDSGALGMQLKCPAVAFHKTLR
jgi:hypothetical protein